MFDVARAGIYARGSVSSWDLSRMVTQGSRHRTLSALRLYYFFRTKTLTPPAPRPTYSPRPLIAVSIGVGRRNSRRRSLPAAVDQTRTATPAKRKVNPLFERNWLP